MNIHVYNRQRRVALRRGQALRLVRFFMQRAARVNPRLQWGDVSLVLVDDSVMQQINQQFLGRNGTTDVIAFRYEGVPGERGDQRSAEVIVNAQQGQRQGPQRGGAIHELALYIAHGCDHLTGAEDDSPVKRRRMRRRELGWLHRAKKLGLLPNRPAKPDVRTGQRGRSPL
jgi:probable rRNA maturation factor